MVEAEDPEIEALIGSDNPGHITVPLCLAYRETLMIKIESVRNQILTGLAIATAILGVLIYLR